MEDPDERLVWLRRLRWRLRGAAQVPAFGLFWLADAALLELLPFTGDDGPGWVGALLLSGFLNLFVVAALAPLLGRGWQRRTGRLPEFAARDRAAVAALVGLCALLALGGVLHRPAVLAEQDKAARQAQAARAWFVREAPPEYLRNLARMSSVKPGPDLYRTCIPGPDPGRALCVIVTTSGGRPVVTADRSQVPN